MLGLEPTPRKTLSQSIEGGKLFEIYIYIFKYIYICDLGLEIILEIATKGSSKYL